MMARLATGFNCMRGSSPVKLLFDGSTVDGIDITVNAINDGVWK